LGELRRRVTRERRLIVALENEGETVADEEAEVIRREGHRVWMRFDPERIPAAELIARVTARHAVRDLFVENPPIEEIIARLYGEARK
jgi:ABC-2 type transport system ATP-binding protein